MRVIGKIVNFNEVIEGERNGRKVQSVIEYYGMNKFKLYRKLDSLYRILCNRINHVVKFNQK